MASGSMEDTRAPWVEESEPEPSSTRKSEDGWSTPMRKIFNEIDLQAFRESQSYKEITSFVHVLNDSVIGKRISDPSVEANANIHKVVTILSQLEAWVSEIPPMSQAMRFGNQAFRTWHQRLEETADELTRPLLSHEHQNAVIELSPYLCDSFGNSTRIDYGTGHETSFICWLYCLSRLGVFSPSDAPALVLHVFTRYIRLMRTLQSTYVMEPAGSHGVWGLDDFHCLPFLFGSAQLIDHKTIVPASIHDEHLSTDDVEDYLYLSSITAIKALKTGAPFSETSPMLHSISQLPSWRKVNSGMFKLFDGEVLGKRPVIQHFLFGQLLPCTWTVSAGDQKTAQSAPPVIGPSFNSEALTQPDTGVTDPTTDGPSAVGLTSL